MTERDIRIVSDPPEAWEMAKNYDATSAYTETGRKPMYPREDYMQLGFDQAERLYSLGLACQPIHPRDAALPVFQTTIIGNDEKSRKLIDLLEPVYNRASDRELFIYGLDVLFACDDAHIACDISYHYTDHSGGGSEDVGTVAIMADGDYFFTYPHYMNFRAHEEFGLYDYTSITTLCNWLGYFWRGIQNQFINRPEHIQYYHRRLKDNDEDSACKSKPSKRHVAKVQRVITICLDEEDAAVIPTGKHIDLPLWSVAGHWRVTKTGKRVWVKPYYKGKDRDKRDAVFSAKEYRFEKEAVDHARS